MAASFSVGHRHVSDPELLWLWHRPAAVLPVRPQAWELPYATGVALERKKKKKIFAAESGRQAVLRVIDVLMLLLLPFSRVTKP